MTAAAFPLFREAPPDRASAATVARAHAARWGVRECAPILLRNLPSRASCPFARLLLCARILRPRHVHRWEQRNPSRDQAQTRRSRARRHIPRDGRGSALFRRRSEPDPRTASRAHWKRPAVAKILNFPDERNRPLCAAGLFQNWRYAAVACSPARAAKASGIFQNIPFISWNGKSIMTQPSTVRNDNRINALRPYWIAGKHVHRIGAGIPGLEKPLA